MTLRKLSLLTELPISTLHRIESEPNRPPQDRIRQQIVDAIPDLD